MAGDDSHRIIKICYSCGRLANFSTFVRRMVTAFHKVTALFLSALVLCSTLSFSADLHYCGAQLVDIAVFTKAHKCAMHDMEPSREMHHDHEAMMATHCEEPVQQAKDCCQDKQVLVEGQDILNLTTLEDISFQKDLLSASMVSFEPYAFIQFANAPPVPPIDYPPPLLQTDRQVLYQTFRI